MFRRLAEWPAPSRQGIISTCTQILPLVEMFCRYELQEDCGDLEALMLRFDSERELQSHALGRSLLFLVRDGDGDVGLEHVSRRTEIDAPTNPFEAVRARLATVDIAIRGLHAQVHFIIGFFVIKHVTLYTIIQWHYVNHAPCPVVCNATQLCVDSFLPPLNV